MYATQAEITADVVLIVIFCEIAEMVEFILIEGYVLNIKTESEFGAPMTRSL